MEITGESRVGESERDVDNELCEPVNRAESCDHHTNRPDLTVRKDAAQPDDKDGYIPGAFTFIPECEMRPEANYWQETFDACIKNPGHHQFLTVYEFLKDPEPILRALHTGDETQGNLMQTVIDFVRHPITTWRRLRHDNKRHSELVQKTKDDVYHISKLTTKVTSFITSGNRPKYFPGTKSLYPFYGETGGLRHATGFLASCLVPQEGECVCGECMESECKQQKYWLCLVVTATHGVCNIEEAENSTFDFFDIDKVMADQDAFLKTQTRHYAKDENEAKDRKQVMTDWDEMMDERKMTIDGTGITVRDFYKRREDFINFLRAQSDDARKNSSVDLELKDECFFHHFIHNLKQQSDYPFVGDMNVVTCVTHSEAIATRLGTVWTDWRRYEGKRGPTIGDMVRYFCPIVSFPHGGPMMVSVGSKPKYNRVGLREVIASGNGYLESHHHTQTRSRQGYLVKANTGSRLIPDYCDFFPPRPLCEADLLPGTDLVKLPVKTEVVASWIDDEGYKTTTRYSLRKTTDTSINCVTGRAGYLYYTYNTPTCPGCSGALVWNLYHITNPKMTHCGGTGKKNKNKSGIHLAGLVL